MSHTATMKINFKNKAAMIAACKALNLQYQDGKHTCRLYSGNVECDFSLKLKGWKYSLAVLDDAIKYDNYGGSWGKVAELTAFQNEYSKQVVIQKADELGWGWMEQYNKEEDCIEIIVNDYS